MDMALEVWSPKSQRVIFIAKKRNGKRLTPIEASLSPCESCILAKHHRESFPKGMSSGARVPLEIVHLDICGPMKMPSLGGRI